MGPESSLVTPVLPGQHVLGKYPRPQHHMVLSSASLRSMLCHLPFVPPWQEDVCVHIVETRRLSLRDSQLLEATSWQGSIEDSGTTPLPVIQWFPNCAPWHPLVCQRLSWMEGRDMRGQGEGVLRSPRKTWHAREIGGDLEVTTALSGNQE